MIVKAVSSHPVYQRQRRAAGFRFRRKHLLFAIVVVMVGVFAPNAVAAPTPVTAYYVSGNSLQELKDHAYNDGRYFAQHHSSGSRILILDFGAARKISSGIYGAEDFSNHTFSNSEILLALKRAADGVHKGYIGGYTTIVYGNNNYHFAQAGLTASDTFNIGHFQSDRALQLRQYQIDNGYNNQDAEAGSDMELAWSNATLTKPLVDGDWDSGYALYYDFGDAAGCPSSGSSGSCSNNWTVAGVAHISWDELALSLPEIYYNSPSDPVNAKQWAVVRRWWEANHSGLYNFAGSTSTSGTGLTPAEGWNALDANNPGRVGSELIYIGYD